MKKFKTELNLEQIIKITGGTITVPSSFLYDNIAELHEASEKSICFFENEKYREDAEQSNAGIILLPQNTEFFNTSSLLIRCEKPYIAFMTLVTVWLGFDKKNSVGVVSTSSHIDKTAILGENCTIGAFVVIEANVKIGDRTVIEANSVIKENTIIGSDCHIYPNVTVYDQMMIGNKVTIHSGSVIGSDGFGYLLMNEIQVKVPQVGNVVIEDDVEIGANTCIDRATIGSTIIGKNSKLDNLVQIGHNCKIGESSILCAQVGLAGNSIVGNRVYLAGQVGVGGHLTIADNTMVGAQSGIASSIPTGKYFGTPVLPFTQQMRIIASLKDLPEISRYYKQILREKK